MSVAAAAIFLIAAARIGPSYAISGRQLSSDIFGRGSLDGLLLYRLMLSSSVASLVANVLPTFTIRYCLVPVMTKSTSREPHFEHLQPSRPIGNRLSAP
jgi:hypothetical protein